MNAQRCIAGICAALSLAVVPAAACAHMMGPSLEKKDGEYLIDIGYDTYPFRAGQETMFNLAVIKGAGTLFWQNIHFTSASVGVQQQDGTVQATDVSRPEFGPAIFLYTFPKPGPYELQARFLSGSTVLADAKFPLTVDAPLILSGGTVSGNAVGTAVTIIFVVAIVWLWSRRPSPRPS